MNVLTPKAGYAFVRSGPSLGGVVYGGSGEQEVENPNFGDPSVSEELEATMGLTCTVSMGGENVTTSAFDYTTGVVEIDEVTGNITVVVEDSIKPITN